MLEVNHFQGRIADMMNSGYSGVVRWKMMDTSTT